jgi:hypothetical protein
MLGGSKVEPSTAKLAYVGVKAMNGARAHMRYNAYIFNGC